MESEEEEEEEEETALSKKIKAKIRQKEQGWISSI